VQHPGPGFDPAGYKAFLKEIGYLIEAPPSFTVTTSQVDDEIAHVAGPQLVVPVSNARYALNAANARWGSLYDALYGTDAIPWEESAPAGGGYNPTRGAKVIDFGRRFLDDTFPLETGSHRDAVNYRVTDAGLEVRLSGGTATPLKTPALAGFTGERDSPSVILLEHHGLHVEIHIDRQHFIGRGDAAGISDIVLEAALTTIQDCEDSVAAVSTRDKVGVYRNWLGLMQATLQAELDKGSKKILFEMSDIT
jgi:malate synthase